MTYDNDIPYRKVDDILEKISRYGISSITHKEREFLDIFSNGDDEDISYKLFELESEYTFEDAYFKFEINEAKRTPHEDVYIGIMYVPDIDHLDGTSIDGVLNGRLVVMPNGGFVLDFDKIVTEDGYEMIYDIYEFCEGLEYEFDNFIDGIINELKN